MTYTAQWPREYTLYNYCLVFSWCSCSLFADNLTHVYLKLIPVFTMDWQVKTLPCLRMKMKVRMNEYRCTAKFKPGYHPSNKSFDTCIIL